jgi:hypothetical protein
MSMSARSRFGLATLALIALLFQTLGVIAAPVSPERAEQVAINWMTLQTGARHSAYRLDFNHPEAAAYQRSGGHHYLFEVEPAGWVIVAADDVAYPILGYSTEGTIVGRSQPPSFVGWMQGVDASIAAAIRQTDMGTLSRDAATQATEDTIAQAWADLDRPYVQPTPSLQGRARAEAVAPLITTTWGQGRYYNAACPADAGGPDGRALVGCCATALGQILRYHGHPATGYGSNTYFHARYGTLFANFGATQYGWAAMPRSGPVNSYNTAVATLLSHAGIAINMDYGPSQSWCWFDQIAPALRSYFRYAAETGASRSGFSHVAWIGKIKTDLDAGRPIFYGGSGPNGGHAFVLDGYTDADYFHFNWGWDGYFDGFFFDLESQPRWIQLFR